MFGSFEVVTNRPDLRLSKRGEGTKNGVGQRMLFLSTFEKPIDKKGRVSVPPTFRAVLASEQFSGVIAFPSVVHGCIEACSMNHMQKMYERIETLDPYSEERDAFATAILGGSVQLAFDGEGRIVLPEALLKAAGIKDAAVFIGKGHTFEIWSQEAFGKHAAQARETAKKQRGALKAGGNA